MVESFATNVAKGSKPSRFAKQRARKSLRVARSVGKADRANPAAPTKIDKPADKGGFLLEL